MNRDRLGAILLLILVALSACGPSAAGSQRPSASPSTTPAPTPTPTPTPQLACADRGFATPLAEPAPPSDSGANPNSASTACLRRAGLRDPHIRSADRPALRARS